MAESFNCFIQKRLCREHRHCYCWCTLSEVKFDCNQSASDFDERSLDCNHHWRELLSVQLKKKYKVRTFYMLFLPRHHKVISSSLWGYLTEWLRWWTRNPLGNSRVGSNPAVVEKMITFLSNFGPELIGRLNEWMHCKPCVWWGHGHIKHFLSHFSRSIILKLTTPFRIIRIWWLLTSTYRAHSQQVEH